MSKQDRQAVRTARDIEIKYPLGRLNAAQSSSSNDTKLIELNQTLSQFMANTNAKFEEMKTVSPTISIEDIEGGHRITITDIDGTKIFDVMDGTSAVIHKPKIGEVTLLAEAWIGENNLYHQVVEIEGVTENSQVDLTPDVEQLAIFYNKDLSFVTENEGGVVTVYVIGQKPENDYTIQVTITEVDV